MAERKHKHKKSSDSDQSLSREDLEIFLKGISSAVKNIAADNKGKGKIVLPHAHDPPEATSLAGQPLRWRRKGLVNCFISTRAGAE